MAAAIGAYFGAYLKRKGEDRAAQEGFDDLRKQVAKTTEETEKIKVLLTGKAWRSQRRWDARERFYTSLLTQLHHFNIALLDLSDYFVRPGSEHAPDSKQDAQFHSLLSRSFESCQEVRRLMGPASLYLSEGTILALTDLTRQYWHLANFSSCTAEYVEGAAAIGSTAYRHVLAEALAQLQQEESDV
jgi:hypothetical protein